MKPINSNGRLAGQRGVNVVHRLDLQVSGLWRKQRGRALRAQGVAVGTERDAIPEGSSAAVGGGTESVTGRQERHQIRLLERRLQKVTRLLEGQESSSRGRLEEGVASVYRVVQGVDARDARAEDKRALMASIFLQNVKLRERVTFGPSHAR